MNPSLSTVSASPVATSAWHVNEVPAVPLAPRCVEAALLRALNGEHRDAVGAALPTGTRLRVAAGAALLHEGAPATQLCVVLAGTFKILKTADDGYDHVLAFALRGDVLGYDGLADGRYASAAVALEDSLVLMLPPTQFDALRRSDPALDGAVQAVLSRQLARAVELAELMSAVAADARLARFLLHLSARMAEQGLSPRRLLLRMNRRDIASHLGLAHETVSRSFGVFAERGWLQVTNREVEILDFAALRATAHNTRGPGDEPVRPAARRAAARPVLAAA